jgi:hypothetical protein
MGILTYGVTCLEAQHISHIFNFIKWRLTLSPAPLQILRRHSITRACSKFNTRGYTSPPVAHAARVAHAETFRITARLGKGNQGWALYANEGVLEGVPKPRVNRTEKVSQERSKLRARCTMSSPRHEPIHWSRARGWCAVRPYVLMGKTIPSVR